MTEQYINVPFKITMRKDLSCRCKIIYGYVNSFFKDECIASNKYVAKILGTTPRTIQRAVKILIDKGLIRRRFVIENGVTQGRILNIAKKRK